MKFEKVWRVFCRMENVIENFTIKKTPNSRLINSLVSE